MSTKDDALIEKMREEYQAVTLSYGYLSGIRAAHTVARKAILEEALRAILKAAEGKPNDVAYGMHEAGRAVVSLATQEQHND